VKNYYKFAAIIGGILICLMFVLSWAQAAVTPATEEYQGWKRHLHIEWGYIPPVGSVVSEVVLYQDDIEVCAFPGKDITAGDCEVTLKRAGTAFALTARFEDGNETSKSSAFTFADFGPGPRIIILIGK